MKIVEISYFSQVKNQFDLMVNLNEKPACSSELWLKLGRPRPLRRQS